jgi:hypothetical protein
VPWVRSIIAVCWLVVSHHPPIGAVEPGVHQLNDVARLVGSLDPCSPCIMGRTVIIRWSCPVGDQCRMSEMRAFSRPSACRGHPKWTTRPWSDCALGIGNTLTDMGSGIRDNVLPERHRSRTARGPIIIGIDPGLTGAVAVVARGRDIVTIVTKLRGKGGSSGGENTPTPPVPVDDGPSPPLPVDDGRPQPRRKGRSMEER